MFARMWIKGKSLAFLVGVKTYTATIKINMEVSQKIENSSASRPSYTTSEHIPKGCSTITQGYMLSYAALFIIARN